MGEKNNRIRNPFRCIADFCKRQNWENFIMEFLSVFLGIIITFAGTDWIEERNEQKNVHEALMLVNAELKDNLDIMQEVQDHVDLELKAAKYLMQYYDNFEACEKDSMRLYCNRPLEICPARVSDEALELLKNSALFQKIKDKELALSIIRAYRNLNILRENYNYYNDKKQKLIDEAMQEKAKAVFARQNFTAAEMWEAITSTDEGKQFLHEIEISSECGYGYDDTREYVAGVISQLDSIDNR